MKGVFRWSQRLLMLAVLMGALIFQFTFTPTAYAASSYCVAGAFQSPEWTPQPAEAFTDDGTQGDAVASDGIYSRSYVIATAGYYEFKIVGDCDWGSGQSWPSANSWFQTTGNGETVTFTFDTNSYDDGFQPSTNIVNVEGGVLPTSFTAAGSFTNPTWQNPFPDALLSDLGSGIFELDYVVPNPAYYEGKVVETGNWGKQFTSSGRTNGDGPTLIFNTSNANETVKITLNTNTGRIRFAPQGDGDTGAEQDNNIWWADLGHDSRDLIYRNPAGAVEAGQDVTLRLRAADGDLTGATVRVWNDRLDFESFLPMMRVAGDGNHEWWETTLDTGTVPNVFYYRFIAVDGTSVAYYEDTDRTGGWGETIGGSSDASWQLTVFDPAFQTPDWVKNAIVYQIFPDRFRDGDSSNNLAAGTFFYEEAGGTIQRSGETNWNTPICDPRVAGAPGCQGSWSRNFYGGDLQGIIDQLDYLQSLGVNTIYLNPIFESPSNHKYDTRDFSQIDDNFGDLATFQTLIAELNARDMYIILDGVFNHTSSDSYYFDRYGLYDDATYGVGACESSSSPRVDWYEFFTFTGEGDAPCSDNRDYPKWFGIFDSLPVLRTAEQPAQDLIWGSGFNHSWSGVTEPIGPYWAMQGIDGWRLDVAPEVDHGIQSEKTDGRAPNANDYWENFRAAVHAVNPELYIVGEEWGIATSWTSGGETGDAGFVNGNVGEWDATMNYQQSSAILSFWRDIAFNDNDFNSGSSAGMLNPLSPSQVNNRLLNLQERYAPEAFYAMMNLFGSHDTNRALFLLDHGHPNSPSELTRHPASSSYDWSDAITRLKGAALMQMTLPGAPTIYYGDEVGTVGQSTYAGGKWEDDPYNRVPYPWLDQSGTPQFPHLQNGGARDSIFAYYQTLTDVRASQEALRTGSFDPLMTDDANNVYVYGRRVDDMSSLAVVMINRAISAQAISVDVSGYAPIGATFDDALTIAVEAYMVDGSGILSVPSVPAMGGALLVKTSVSNAVPAAVVDLVISGSSSNSVDLSWSAASGAVNYHVYRSLVSGGGYEYIGMTAGTTYADTGLTPGQKRYYVVKSVNGDAVTSDYSNEVVGLPQWNLGGAWYSLSTANVQHVISTETRTSPIYGQLWVDGGTNQLGPIEGIIAQVGFGSSTDPADGTWVWANMDYDSEVGNNDQFVGTLLPTSLGTFNLLTRYSSDSGETWVYGDIDGAPFSGAFGTLDVIASDDANNPSTPQNLTVTNITSSALSFEWEASSDTLRAPAVAGYRIYRKANGTEDAASVIGETNAATTTFTDSTVTVDTTYDYFVTAFDTSFNESDPSNIVTVTAEDLMIEVTFRTTVPDWTPGNIYITGDQPELGPWNPGLHQMTPVDGQPNVWEFKTSFLSGTQVTFKHARGDWDRVEKQEDGFAEIEYNFTVANEGELSQLIETTIQNWRDPIVVSHEPAEGAQTSVKPVISITWNKDMGVATEFEVLDKDDVPVVGSYAYDNSTYTVTFTPDNVIPEGLVTVNVNGFSVGGDTQKVAKTFTFTAAVSPFNLLSPYDGTLFRRLSDLTGLSWTESLYAQTYEIDVFKTSNNVRIGQMLDIVVPAQDVCVAETGVCTYSFTPEELAFFTDGAYAWSVHLDGGVEAVNAPFDFAISTGPWELVYNGGMEINDDGNKIPDGWRAVNRSSDGLKCNENVGTPEESLITPYGNCALQFKHSTTENSRFIQRLDETVILDGDTILFSAMVDPRNAPEGIRIGKVVVVYEDGTRQVLKLALPSAALKGVEDYVPVMASGQIDLTAGEISRVKVFIGWKGKTGKFNIDEVSVLLQQPDSLPSGDLIPGFDDGIPLPEAPDGSRFRKAN